MTCHIGHGPIVLAMRSATHGRRRINLVMEPVCLGEDSRLVVPFEVPMLLRMFAKRLRSYRGIGYAKGEAPLGFAEPSSWS